MRPVRALFALKRLGTRKSAVEIAGLQLGHEDLSQAILSQILGLDLGDRFQGAFDRFEGVGIEAALRLGKGDVRQKFNAAGWAAAIGELHELAEGFPGRREIADQGLHACHTAKAIIVIHPGRDRSGTFPRQSESRPGREPVAQGCLRVADADEGRPPHRRVGDGLGGPYRLVEGALKSGISRRFSLWPHDGSSFIRRTVSGFARPAC